ncbi:MAG: HAMP domain-containing histidine kinase, partial [Chloroflexi bacterium]|nr:HAMP domain-containing histidine kinase [Chloroflexota bacterium]
EFLIRHEDGKTVAVLASAVPISDESGKVVGAVATILDITERKRAEQFREEYIHMVSHDLRAPLTVIQGQAQLVHRSAKKEDLVRKSADAILISSQRMNSMIQDLVDSARLEAGQLHLEKQPVDLRSFLAELLERMREGIDGVDRVKVEMPTNLPPANADTDRLERIFTNLITNALKYSPPETEVLVKAQQTNGEVMVSVTDHGIGIATEDLPHPTERDLEQAVEKPPPAPIGHQAIRFFDIPATERGGRPPSL